MKQFTNYSYKYNLILIKYIKFLGRIPKVHLSLKIYLCDYSITLFLKVHT